MKESSIFSRSGLPMVYLGLVLLAVGIVLPPILVLAQGAAVNQFELLGPFTADGPTDVVIITSVESDNTAGIQIQGEWGNPAAEATLEMRLCSACTWLPMPGATNPYTDDEIVGPVAVYRDTEIRIVISGVEVGVTAISFYLAR